MSLKKLTDSIHRKAEQTKWSQLLVSGNMTHEQYGQYLYNLLYIYSALETKANELNIFKDYPLLKNIQRVLPLTLDRGWFPYISGYEQSCHKFIDYINTFNKDQVLAHMYVRHFGDMYGGQIIAKKVPDPREHFSFKNRVEDTKDPNAFDESLWTCHYQFKDKNEIIRLMRSLLKDEMADEAILGFQYAIDLFHDLEKRFDL